MKKTLLSLFIALVATTAMSAQDTFKQGDVAMNFGVGFANALTINSSTVVPPVSVSAEYGVIDNLVNGNNGSIGAGAYIGYTSYKIKDSNLSANYTILGARGAYHHELHPKVDTYAGMIVGLAFSNGELLKDKDFGRSYSSTKLAYGVFVGARYMFVENIGAFAELGWGVSAVNVGLALKF
ncbi:opacity family porin [Porphyromonas sp.]|uniref:opacity family porin n=1 Tax=Porphyromonas sp. TaxID=1924944 RepID=UPI0026DB0BBF|nr:opacity family porin [Porphyromonas sp.]MDO4771113.1 outer membrane beta-barrel protein [Porphyromonas sp.]